MDIKERFYSKLQQLREESDDFFSPVQKKAMNKAASMYRKKGHDVHNTHMSSLPTGDRHIIVTHTNTEGKKMQSHHEFDPKDGHVSLQSVGSRMMKEEQLDELRKPKDIDKLKKHMGKAARAREDAMMRDTYNPAYDDETEARRNALRSKTPEARKKAEEAGENRKSAASKMVKIQRVADKLERKKK